MHYKRSNNNLQKVHIFSFFGWWSLRCFYHIKLNKISFLIFYLIILEAIQVLDFYMEFPFPRLQVQLYTLIFPGYSSS